MTRLSASILRMGVMGLALMSLLAVAPSVRAATSPTITVMTRNVYYGADVRPLAIVAPGPPLWAATAKMFNGMKSEDPKGRMKLVAAEIAKAKPDVVGLQELAIWRTGPAPASKTVFDFLHLITADLKKLHQSYRIASVESGLDVEAQMAEGTDMRLTLQDAVLVRNGVKVSHATSGLFQNQLVFPTRALGSVPVKRGYNAMDVTKKGVTVHLVNTHIEAFGEPARNAQANELIAGPLRSKNVTILVGDLNAAADNSNPANRAAYNAIAASGFVPTRTTDFNCCYRGVKDSNPKHWDHDVDWIMSRPAQTLVKGYVTGTATTKAGVHAGDHGGVVSVIQLKG